MENGYTKMITELPSLDAHLSLQAIPSDRENENGQGRVEGHAGRGLISPAIHKIKEYFSDIKWLQIGGDSPTLSQEQFIKVSIPIDPILSLLDDSEKQNEKTHLIIAIDNSGSMSGSPLRQALSALKEILGNTVHLRNIQTDVVVYNSTARVVMFDEHNYVEQINAIKATGGTCFREAFNKMAELVRNEEADYSRRIITFLTDGHDGHSANVTPEEKVKSLVDTGKPFSVHCVGFSKDHNYKLLRDLCKFGLGDGMFRYCENQDGPDALKDKLQELFDFILLNLASNVDVNIAAEDGCKLLYNGNFVSECVLSGDIEESETLEDSHSGIIVNSNITVSGKETVRIPCKVTKADREVLSSAADKIQWNLRTLTRNADILASKLGEAISENKDVSKFGSRIEKMQEKLAHIPIFNIEFDKHLREAFRALMADIQTKINKMRTMLAEFVRGDTQSIQMLARAHDMRYQAKFSKSRRQRIMDKRALKNIGNAKLAQSQLDTLMIDKQEVERITQDAADYYFCALSQNSVKDILLGKDKEDIMGFGVAVQRPEHVLDEPSMIRLCNISGTFVSRTAMLDALEYKINCSGQLSAHGGFDFDNPLGVTTVGTSREPINAWLPLYCTQQHWNKVKVLMEPTLGYFCTLDPLGFDRKQYDVMFMVLGSMVGQITENVGEHQLKQIFSFVRTCHALAQEIPKFQEESRAMLVNFLNHPQDRLKHVIPNMDTLIGRMLSLPVDVLKSCLKDAGSDDTQSTQKIFWRAYLAEVIRRSAGSLLRETSPHTTNGYIHHILQGNPQGSSPRVNEGMRTLIRACQDCKATKDDLPNVTYDPKQGITIKEITAPHDEKMDKVMEFWAQAECDIIKNKNQAEKIAEAKKSVKKWKAEGVESVACDSIDAKNKTESRQSQEDFDNLTEEMIKEMAEFLTVLTSTHHQVVNGFPGCLAFLRYWLSCQHEYKEIDDAYGLPPEGWIQEVKEAVNSVYTCMNDHLQQMMTEKVEEQDVLVVTGHVASVQRDSTGPVLESEVTTKGKVVDEDSNRTDDGNNDDTGDEDLDDYDIDDDDYGDDDYTRQARHRKQKKYSRKVTVPELYHLIDPKIDAVQMCRILLCQVLSYHSNSKARSAITGNKFVDLSQKVDYHNELQEFNTTLEQLKQSAAQDAMNKVIWDRTNQCMLNSTSVWAFIGYMMTTYKDRDQGFSDLFTKILDLDKESKKYPLLAEKVKVMLLGKYQDVPVIANGNVRYVEPKIAKKFAVVLGEEAWSEIEVEARSNVKLHVYRESDIPNRHGHCNSNPYIPNVLRAKLGMKLLPESKTRPGSRRYKLKNK